MLLVGLLATEALNNCLPAPVVVTSGLAGGTKGGQCAGCFWTNSNILKFSFRISWGNIETVINIAVTTFLSNWNSITPSPKRVAWLLKDESRGLENTLILYLTHLKTQPSSIVELLARREGHWRENLMEGQNSLPILHCEVRIICQHEINSI